MSNILIIDDKDSKEGLLSSRKISAYHKSKGDRVGRNISDPDIVYASIIFEKNKHQVDGLKFYYPDAEIRIGGSGVNLERKLPEEIEFIKPDYDLEPKIDYSLGFTSRGCIRNCEFCIVRQKEGGFKRWQHPKHFHDDRFNKIRLYDNNILADKDWFFEVTDWILKKDLKVDFNQGLDIRLLDDDIVKRISELNRWHTLNFAWDFIEIEEDVMKGIDLLKKYNINLKQDVGFYVLTNFNTTHEEDLYRCNKLKEKGTNAFVMQYDGGDYFTRKLGRWANKRRIYWSIDFEDYDRTTKKIDQELKNIKEEVKT